jgi:arylsulfatase A-like enzyme
MFRLALLSLQRSLNEYVLLYVVVSIILSIVVVLASSTTRFVRKSSRSDTTEVADPDYILKLHSSCVVSSIFFVCGGWAINHYWLPSRFHPLSLLGDAGILLAAILLWRLLLRVKWVRLLKTLSGAALVIAILLVILNLTVVIDRKISRPQGPNVILIVVDTLRADHLSCYGYDKNTSPTIDELSEHAILFRNAISTAPWTTPSVASMFTSQYPTALGIEEEPVVLSNELLTLAEIFRGNNYRTAGVISHVLVSRVLGFAQGFDSYDEENAKGHDHVSSPSIAKKAISYVEKHKNDRFFLFLHWFDPHHSFIMHEDYDYYPDYEGRLYSGQVVEEQREIAPNMSVDDIRYIRALYDSEINFTDEHIGILLDKLKELGLYDNTVVVLTADHGEEFLERGDYWIGHSKRLYQEMIHVPLIIKLAGDHKPQIVEEYTGLIDLMPTIVDRAGLSIPDECRCEGAAIDLAGGRQREGKVVISETNRLASLRSLTWDGWKLIYDAANDTRELYNLVDDPAESGNVAMENKQILAEMEAVLRKWYEQIRAEESETTRRQPSFTEEQKKRLRSLSYIR